ncbi:MAG: ATP-binding cassette domain-containing protein [bacterium]
MTPTILVDHLSKTYQVDKKIPGLLGSLKGLVHRQYDEVKAVDDINFEIDEGELVGFIGPNGAGKTTTLKMLSGLLYPSSGKVTVLNEDPWGRSHTFLKSISLIMGQKNQLWWDLPAIESFNLGRDIYEIPEIKYKKTLNQLVYMLDLGDVLNVQVRKLSLGQRMKAELVSALLHQPKVLFLDEPTIGLDVVMQKTLRQFIKDYNREFHGAIILTSHYMDDVKELCKRVIIIDKGRVVFDGLLQNIVTKFANHKNILVSLESQVALSELKKIEGFEKIDGTVASYHVTRSQIPSIASMILKDLPVSDIDIREPEIEDVIREVFTSTKS